MIKAAAVVRSFGSRPWIEHRSSHETRLVPISSAVFSLPGGNEDNDRWAELRPDEGNGWPVIISVWELGRAARAAITAGGTIELVVWAREQVPVALSVGESIATRKLAT